MGFDLMYYYCSFLLILIQVYLGEFNYYSIYIKFKFI